MRQHSLTSRVFFLSLGSAIQKGSGLIVVMLLVRLLDMETYGTYQQVLLVGGMIYGFFASGISAGIYYFLPRLEGERRASFMLHTVTLMGVLGAASAIVVFVFGAEIAAYFNNVPLEKALHFYAAYVFFWIGTDYFLPFLNASNRYGTSVFCGVLEATINGLFLIVPLWQSVPFPESLALLCIAAGVRYLAYLVITLRLTKARSRAYDVRLVRDHITYSTPLMASGWTDVLGGYLERVVVSLLYKPATVAIYAIGTIQVPIWEMVAKPVNIVLRVKFAELHGEQRTREIRPIWHEAVRKQSMIVMPIVCLLWVLADHVIRLMFTDAYAESVWILRVSLIDKLLFVMSFSVFPLSMGRSDVLLKGSVVFLAANALILAGLADSIGPFGPVAARVAATYLTYAYYAYVIIWQMRIPMEVFFPFAILWKVMAANLASGVLAYGVAQAIESHVAAIVVAGFVYVAAYVGALWAFGTLRPDDLKTIARAISLRNR